MFGIESVDMITNEFFGESLRLQKQAGENKGEEKIAGQNVCNCGPGGAGSISSWQQN